MRRTVARRTVMSLLLSLVLGVAAASAPCGALLASYLEPHDGEVVPCLVDLQEAGLCFRLPGMTLETATRTVDAHLQAQGTTRPAWSSSASGNAAVVVTSAGDRVEVVVAHDGPFATGGTCRLVPERRPAAPQATDL